MIIKVCENLHKHMYVNKQLTERIIKKKNNPLQSCIRRFVQLHVISILLFKAIIIRFTMSEETLGTKNLASKKHR